LCDQQICVTPDRQQVLRPFGIPCIGKHLAIAEEPQREGGCTTGMRHKVRGHRDPVDDSCLSRVNLTDLGCELALDRGRTGEEEFHHPINAISKLRWSNWST